MEFRNYKNTYIAALEAESKAEQTIKTYVSCLQMFFNHFKNEKDPKEVNAEQIKFFLVGMSSQAYQRQMYGALKNFYKWVIHQPNKMQYVPFAKREEKLPVVLSQQEIESIILACNNLKHKCILSLIYGFGLRRSELINLQFDWIDRERMILKVKGKGYIERQVPINDRLLRMMEAYYAQYRPTKYLIEGATGGKYSATSIAKILKRAMNKAGIRKKATVHSLRHSYATHLLEAGVSLRIIQSLLGHKNSKTTERYTTVSSSHLNEVFSPIQAINI